MTTLTTKKRDDAKALLEDHQKVSDALDQVDKVTWVSVMCLANEKDNDSVEVSFHHTIARKALKEQKDWTAKELAKLGLEIK